MAVHGAYTGMIKMQNLICAHAVHAPAGFNQSGRGSQHCLVRHNTMFD
uniref:Uncharacterized protein n=1 Tax=Anguilla anguilla TaxID=7936 RepID=A0A0E9THH9_ANGAN